VIQRTSRPASPKTRVGSRRVASIGAGENAGTGIATQRESREFRE
jgi:hypothetical protein